MDLRRLFVGVIVVVSFALALTTVTAVTAGTGNQKVMKKSLLTGANVPRPVRAILGRACQDCHSENTVWPWYSHFPPISWEVQADVERGRAFMDLSKWDKFSESERRGFTASIEAAVQHHVMPPPKYVLMHREARLSTADLHLIRAWALAAHTAAHNR